MSKPSPRTTRRPTTILISAGALLLFSTLAHAAPPPPSGGHPRLFLSTTVHDKLVQAAADKSSGVSAIIANCQDVIDKPDTFPGSGYQGFDWSSLASSCAFAYQLTGDAKFATLGIKVWKALLEDVNDLGDKMACVAGADEATAIASIRRDTGYAIRMIGPHTALAYDWLHDAPGVTEAFRQQSRDCFRHWITWYTREGYHNEAPGSNYHAGFVAAKALIAIAEAGEDGASSDQFWTEVVDDVFGDQMVANGLAQDNGGIPKSHVLYHGALVGADWAEGWQYGPLSVMEYAYATRALQEQGVDLAPLSQWSSDLTLREIYGLLPDRSGMYAAGDMDGDNYFGPVQGYPLDATRLGQSSDEAAGWAAFVTKQMFPDDDRGDLWKAIADTRAVTPADPRQAGLPLWFLAKGTRNLYARSSWQDDSFWAVFTSAPRQASDHQHMDSSNFVFTRGGDGLVVDPSPSGTRSSLTSNALTVGSNIVTGDYAPSQTPWSSADMPLARGTASGVVAARGDIAGGFNFSSMPSDIKLARRDWIFLPEGEIVTIDRLTTPSATQKGYLRFRSPGTFTAMSDSPFIARATSGGSALAVHAVKLSPAMAPVLRAVTASNACDTDPSITFGDCRGARADAGEYAWEVPGPNVLAVHVLDGLAGSEAPADVAPIDAPPIDDGAGQNAGVIGASIFRAQKQTFAVEPATLPAPATLTYGVPGGNPSRHVVFDAPADGMGRTTVTATATGDRCVVTLTAGAGVTGAPAIFTLASAADGCTVSEDANVPPGSTSPGSGGFERPGGGTSGGGGKGEVVGGCSCLVGGAGGDVGALGFVIGLAAALAWRLRRRRSR